MDITTETPLLNLTPSAPCDTLLEPDYQACTLTEIIGHLLRHHHPYTLSALENLAPLLNIVVSVHADKHPELHDLYKLFNKLRDDMSSHLAKEENILFPYVLSLETDSPLTSHFGSVANPVRIMVSEHAHESLVLKRIRGVTDGFTPPAGACASYTSLYAGLQELVKDIFIHIDLENNILFPKAIATEKIVLGR
jgi:regulator of cell morphogenesis and NO signaling